MTQDLSQESTILQLARINPFLFIGGLPCPCCVQASLSLCCPKLTIPGFPYNCLPVSCGDIGSLKKILGLVLAWKSGLKVSFLPLGRSCPLQTILLCGLVGCDGPLQMVTKELASQIIVLAAQRKGVLPGN